MSDTPEMVERVGQALDALLEDWAHGKVTTADLSRTAIQAMRVATKPMSDAGWTVSETADREWRSCTPRMLWAAMIDAALAAPDEGEGP